MLSLQSKEIVSYEECIKLIEEMLNILKRETLFGKSHKNISIFIFKWIIRVL